MRPISKLRISGSPFQFVSIAQGGKAKKNSRRVKSWDQPRLLPNENVTQLENTLPKVNDKNTNLVHKIFPN